MSKQVYFVVYYDTEDKELYLDDGTLLARFPDGTIWDTKKEEWLEDAKISILAEAQEAITTAIKKESV